ncbi:MAG: hypothetical protein J6A88_07010 [Oscillospiraceae bacterium]|nr:hypothetical protein [Oscillospiraceae bacterium]
MDFIPTLLFAGLIFGICFLADKGFRKLFRSKTQHASGLAVRSSKRNGLFGVGLITLGIASMIFSQGSLLMLIAGGIILLSGIGLSAYYLSFGIFYDADSFLCTGLFKKSRTYRYEDIRSQQLYMLTGGSTMIELTMADGSAVLVQSNMDGAYPFLDAAFDGWCKQTGRDPHICEFHDPANSCWFPKTEEH